MKKSSKIISGNINFPSLTLFAKRLTTLTIALLGIYFLFPVITAQMQSAEVQKEASPGAQQSPQTGSRPDILRMRGGQNVSRNNLEPENISDMLRGLESAMLTGCPTVSFGIATNFAVGTNPDFLALDDFNGDGKKDLAVVNEANNNVSILLGTGTGSFTFAANYPVAGPRPQSVSLSDFNGDGKIDLAVSNADSNVVSVLLGTGTGSFGTAVNFPVGAHPEDMAVSDFNNDGKSDLAVPNQNANSVSILIGAGDGSFSPPNDFAVGAAPRNVTVGDFNGDGKPDISTANIDSDSVSVLLGNGDGSFGAATNFATNSRPSDLAVGDFNGDGNLDLAVPNYASDNVSIFLGTGTGNFNPPNSFAGGAGPLNLIPNDFNGDGNLDLAAVDYNSNSISILLGNGTGNFNSPISFVSGSGPSYVISNDFNSDGKADLASVNYNSNNVSVLLNTSCASHTISGNITRNGLALSGVAVALSGSSANTATTDGSGNYSFTVADGGSYTVTPSLAGNSFAPASRSFNFISQNQTADFTASLVTHTISGNITRSGAPLSGVTINLGGSSTGSATTDINGNYSLTVNEGGNYTITPSLAGNVFSPLSQTFNNVTVNQTANFTALFSTYMISGNVKADGANLQGATVSLTGSQSQTTATDANGNYSFTASTNGNYTVTASKNGITFNPASQTVSNLQSNQAVNFASGVPLCSPPSTGLVGWYRAEDNVNDSSGNGNIGTQQNGAAFSNGKVGRNFLLDGVNDYIDIPDVPSNSPTTAVSLQAWIKPHSIGTGQAIISNLNASNDNGTFHFVLRDDGSLQLDVFQSTTIYRQAITAPGLITPNIYQHVAATFNTSTQVIKIYVNGVDEPATITGFAVTSLFDVATHPRIGAYTITGTFGAPFNGEIDEAQIYNRALTVLEVQSNYNAGSAGICLSSTSTGAGSLDPSFGTGGKVLTPIGSSDDIAFSTAIQTDGKIVAVGRSYNGSNYDFALTRYNTNGSLDTSFGTGGKVTTPIGSFDDIAFSTAIQADGKIVVVGYSYNGSNSDFALTRYDTNGSLDTSFGTGGKVLTPIGSSNDYAQSVAIQTDGKIVAAGNSNNGSNSDTDFALVRYNTDGSLDNSFGTSGKVTTALGVGNDSIGTVTIISDGKIVAVGESNNFYALVRYNTNGSLDTTFGTGGKVLTRIDTYSGASSAAIQADGKIVAAGYNQTNSTIDFALIRYNIDGSLDTSFGSGGKVDTPIGNSQNEAKSVVIQPDGKIIEAGVFYVSGSVVSRYFALARYNTNGSLDTTFGTGGKVTTLIGSGSSANSLALQADGKIVVAGYSYNGSQNDFALVRYNGTSINVAPSNNLNVNFSNVMQSGYTVATSLTTSQLPALPTGYALPANAPMYDIRTSAGYSGNIIVSFNVPNVADGATCNNLRSLHFENGAWTTATNAAPGYNSATQVCTVSQTVTSLSPFVVAQALAPTAAQVSIGGRVLTASGGGIRNANVTLIDSHGSRRRVTSTSFGHYRFDEVAAGETYVISVAAKKYNFSQPAQVRNVNENLTDIDFIADENP